VIFFWQQRQLYDVGFMLYGTKVGDYADSGYDPSIDSVVISEISPARHNNTNQYAYIADVQGKRVELAFPPDVYEFQAESWYTEPLQTGEPVWTSVYSWEINPYPLAIAFASPIYDGKGKIIGATAVEHLLSQISDFLRSLTLSPNGKVFVIERDGLLIATSGEKQPFTIVDDLPVRLNILNSEDMAMKATANYLIKSFGGFNQINQAQQVSFSLNGERNFVQVMPWGKDIGLDWLVVITVPESDFMAQINANARTTTLLCFVALGIAVWLDITPLVGFPNPSCSSV
jgi:hypothetical protein